MWLHPQVYTSVHQRYCISKCFEGFLWTLWTFMNFWSVLEFCVCRQINPGIVLSGSTSAPEPCHPPAFLWVLELRMQQFVQRSPRKFSVCFRVWLPVTARGSTTAVIGSSRSTCPKYLCAICNSYVWMPDLSAVRSIEMVWRPWPQEMTKKRIP